MKKYLFFLSTLFLFACGTQEKAETVTTANLSGTITNPKGDIVKLSNGTDKIQANLTDGKFTMVIELTEAGNYNFSHGGESTSMYVEPGDNISMALNTTEFDETLTYTGTGSEENNYLASRYMLNETEMGDASEFYKSDEATFISRAAEIKTQKDKFFAKYQKENPNMNTTFLADEKIHLLYDWAGLRNRYENYHRHYAEDNEFKVSESYNDFMNDLEMDNSDLLSSETYQYFISSYYDSKAKDIKKNDKTFEDDKSSGWLKAQLAAFEKHSKNDAIKSFLTYGALKDQISFSGTDGIEPILTSFKETSNNKKQNTELQELWDKWAALAKGEIAPGFEYADIAGKKIALKDFKGKNVYIDVWATWCGPCRKEIPHLEELQKQYMGNENIVFASVSIDDDKEAWEKMVKEKEMMGVHIIGDKAWDSDICNDYLIRGIPRFILVDKEGKIINAKAPRPSSDKIKVILKDMAKPVMTSMK